MNNKKEKFLAVVDDDFTARKIIADFLEDEGYEVISADKPEKIESFLKSFSIIIMDVAMGRNERYAGLDFILESQKNGMLSEKTMIVFISNFGYNTPEIQSRLDRISLTSKCLDKPIEMTELRAILKGSDR